MTVESWCPAVSVVMPVYNGEAYLQTAIDSVLNQTFTDFELIIVDDGSIDHTRDVVIAYRDSRIRLLCNDRNLGPGETLNKGIAHARGSLIAVMHSDDVCRVNRLARQVNFMTQNPSIGLCGSWVKVFGLQHDTWQYATNSDDIKSMLLFRSAFAHPTVMMRKEVVANTATAYSSRYRYTEDYDLWCRLAPVTDFANLAEVLLDYRLHQSQGSTKYNIIQQAEADEIRLRELTALGIQPSVHEWEIHRSLSKGILSTSEAHLRAVQAWLDKLLEANRRHACYPHQAFAKLLAQYCENHIWMKY